MLKPVIHVSDAKAANNLASLRDRGSARAEVIIERDVRQLVQEMLAFRDREGPTLGGRVTIRELIEEGRRL